MKKFLIIMLMFVGLCASAKEQEIFVLPLFMTDAQNCNVYGFDTVSEIMANSIIRNFLVGNKINTVRMVTVKSLYGSNPVLKEVADKYRKTGLVDFEKLTSLTRKNSVAKILLVVAYVEDANFEKLDAWDVLKLSTDFGIDYPYKLVTTLILIDNTDGVALWQKTYTAQLSSQKLPFMAQNYTQAIEQYEKIRSYAENVISKDAEQNLILRLNHKSIDFSSLIKKNNTAQEGIGLKYYKKGVPVKITQPKETFEEQLLKDDTFSL